MNSTNNPFLWDKQCPSFLGPINAIQRESPMASRKPNSFHDITPSEARTSSLTRCDMCFQNPVQTYTCSNCPKSSCSSCIQQKSVGHNLQCPHCLRPLKNSSSSEQENAAVCQDHKNPVSYYCLTCKVVACADCAMFEEKHKNHKFEKLEKAYEEKIGQINNEVGCLGQRLDKLKELLVTLDSNITQATKNKETRATELSVVTEQMAQRLGTELKSKLAVFIAQKGMINGEIDFLQRTQHAINHQLGTWSKGFLMMKGDETLKNLQEINAKASQDDEYNKVSLNFASEITPLFDTGYFTMQPFSVLRQTTEVVYSEPLCCYGLKWRLKVYPNGNGTAKGEYLSVFLEMMEGLKKPSRYEYQVEMINQRSSEIAPVTRDFVSEFEAGECWGYNRFFKINMLEEEGYLVPEKDAITLRFSVRAQTYHQQCHDQKTYIKSLEEARSQDQLLIAELRKQLEAETQEKQRLLEEKAKSVTLAQDLLDVGEIKATTPKKELPKESHMMSISSIEALENGTPYDDLILKIRGQKESSIKVDSQKVDKNAFYNLLESRAPEDFVQKKEVQEEIKEKEKVAVEDKQNGTKQKEGADLCAQFEMLECSFDDVSSCSVQEESEDGENKEDTVDVEHVTEEQGNQMEQSNKERRGRETSNKTQNSSPGPREVEEDLQYENYEASSNNISDGSGYENREFSSGRESLDQSAVLSKLNDLLSKFDKGNDSVANKNQKRGAAAGELDGSPSLKKRTIWEEREENEKKTLSTKVSNDPYK